MGARLSLPLAAAALLAATPAWAAPEGGEGRPRLAVTAARGALSVELRRAPLGAVLEAIARETGLVVRAYAPLERAVSERFEGLALEPALRRLLRPFNVAFVYAEGGVSRGRAARLAEVVIYPEAARNLPREPLLSHQDPVVRRQAFEAAEESGRLSPEALRRASLTDPDLQVRWAAFAALVATVGREAAAELASEGLRSPSAPIRLAALEALGEQLGGEAGEAAARAALADPDPAVRAKAEEIVAIIEEGARLGAEEEAAGLAVEEADGRPEEVPGRSG